MAKHKVRVIQVFRVEREIVIEVGGPSMAGAVELQSLSDAPDDSDPRWTETLRELMNERVVPA